MRCTTEDVVQLLELQPPSGRQQCASWLLLCEPTSSHFQRPTSVTTHFQSGVEMVVAFGKLRGCNTEASTMQSPARSNKPTSILALFGSSIWLLIPTTDYIKRIELSVVFGLSGSCWPTPMKWDTLTLSPLVSRSWGLAGCCCT